MDHYQHDKHYQHNGQHRPLTTLNLGNPPRPDWAHVRYMLRFDRYVSTNEKLEWQHKIDIWIQTRASDSTLGSEIVFGGRWHFEDKWKKQRNVELSLSQLTFVCEYAALVAKQLRHRMLQVVMHNIEFQSQHASIELEPWIQTTSYTNTRALLFEWYWKLTL